MFVILSNILNNFYENVMKSYFIYFIIYSMLVLPSVLCIDFKILTNH